MDYADELVKAGRKHDQARAAAAQAEAERDYMIRQAHVHGKMTVRAIAGLVGMSHQRVGQIVTKP